METKDLFLMIEAISNEKNISQEDVFEALEEALSLATKKQKGWNVEININRDTGDFATFRIWQVIGDGESFVNDDGDKFDSELHIYKADANGVEVDDFVKEKVESMEFGRIAAQIVKQVIIQKVRAAERSVIIAKYENRIGEIISSIVSKIIKGSVYIDLGGVDGVINRNDIIPNEQLRKGDRIRAYIKEIKESQRGSQVILSRTDNGMLNALFAMEVPEIADGVIEIMKSSRDAGIRSKIAVKAKDPRIDAIGSCIGMRGTRVQAVTNELNGEKIDIVLWDADPVKFVINAIAPAEVSSIVVNKNNYSMDVAFGEDQLAQAIGRGGQNIKLASSITGWKLNAISIEEAENKQNEEEQKSSAKLAGQLGVDQNVASMLIAKGFDSIDSLAFCELEELKKIKGLDSNSISDLQERANDAQLVQALENADSSEVLIAINGVDDELSDTLINAGITTVDSLAELSIDELLDIYQIDREQASSIILAAREAEGWFK